MFTRRLLSGVFVARSMARYSVLALLIFLPIAAQASDDAGSTFSIFTIRPTDYSAYFLGMIFGNVHGILHGNNPLFGLLFRTFNNVLLILGGLIACYMLVVGTLRSAAEGELLGRRWSTFMTPIRVALGFLLLAPMASGYSLIQVFFIWAGMQGIAAADTMWDEIVNYFLKGGKVYTGIVDNSAIYTASGNLLQSLTCAETLAYEAKTNLLGQPVVSPYYHEPGSNKYTFPGNVSVLVNGIRPAYANTWPGVCGSFTWTDNAKDGQSYMEAGVNQMIFDLQPVAKQIAEQQDVTKVLGVMALTQLIYSSQAYSNLTNPIKVLISQRTAGLKSAVAQDMKAKGWIMAGSYYYDIYKMSSAIDSLPGDYIPTWSPPNLDASSGTSHFVNPFGSTPDIFSIVNIYTMELQPIIQQSIITQTRKALPIGPNFQGITINASERLSGAAGTFISLITFGMSNVVNSWQEYFGYTRDQNNTTDPITRLAKFGNVCMDAAEHGWLYGGVFLFGMGMVGGLLPCVQAATTIVLFWILPIVAVVMTSLLFSGLMLAFFIPMMPFVIFTFAGIGWFISMIEAACAAPLVALGIAYPEGSNSIYSKVEPALMLLVAVFLRPCLILIGMFSGMILIYVSVYFLNVGFSYAFGKFYYSTGGGSITGLFPVIGLILVYTGIILALVKKCFSLIDVIPDRVLTWIGGGRGFAPRFGEGSRTMIQEFESGYSSGARSTAEAHTSGLTTFAKKYYKKYKEGGDDQQQGQKENNSEQSVGGDQADKNANAAAQQNQNAAPGQQQANPANPNQGGAQQPGQQGAGQQGQGLQPPGGPQQPGVGGGIARGPAAGGGNNPLGGGGAGGGGAGGLGGGGGAPRV